LPQRHSLGDEWCMLVQNMPQSLIITAESGLGVERWCLKRLGWLQVGVEGVESAPVAYLTTRG